MGRKVGGLPVEQFRAAVEANQQYVIAELEHLVGTDVPASIARRLGYSGVEPLRRSLMRWGRHDLARLLNVEPRVSNRVDMLG